ncbi:MAG: xanthine phosphoribosyltransferase [Clostridiales bacterium]|nr:xanthine phosphoribosyltransferase [Clostridiales bacterium]
MKALQERIAKEGRIIDGRIIKVDGFLNHRVDVELLNDMGKEFHRIFGEKGITKILTAEASGIAVAVIAAQYFHVPVVFAKKAKSDNIEGGLYASEIFSYTYNKKVTFLVSKQWLGSDDKVLIIDDFLANGEAVRGLVDIVAMAGAELCGIGVAVEKGFQDGGKKLREQGIDLHSLAIIDGVVDGKFIFREE